MGAQLSHLQRCVVAAFIVVPSVYMQLTQPLQCHCHAVFLGELATETGLWRILNDLDAQEPGGREQTLLPPRNVDCHVHQQLCFVAGFLGSNHCSS